ncbi:MAG: disulfide bond formation protein B [Alphaproteobacteria bacterium]
MTPLSRFPERSLIPLAVLWASALILGGAYAFEYLGGLAPCVLCLYQRVPYWAAIALSLAALILSGRPRTHQAQTALVYLCGLAFVAGAGIAAFHVGVEQHWWQGTTACGPGAGAVPESLAELEARLGEAPVARCDEVAWSLFGISMAGYNVILSVVLAAFCLVAPRLAGSRQVARRLG